MDRSSGIVGDVVIPEVRRAPDCFREKGGWGEVMRRKGRCGGSVDVWGFSGPVAGVGGDL